MIESIFGEFQYFIRRINSFRNGGKLAPGESIEDLEQRFRVQVKNGLVISDPGNQEVAMEILLSSLSENKKRNHLMELRKTGTTDFKLKKESPKTISSPKKMSQEEKKERALDLMLSSLNNSGIKAQKQPLGVKMLLAEYNLKNIDYDDPKDLKLLFVETITISGHAKKANPLLLASEFNKSLFNI